MDPISLFENRRYFRAGRKELLPAVRSVVEKANRAVEAVSSITYSVVTAKSDIISRQQDGEGSAGGSGNVTRLEGLVVPPSGDVHDYYSLAPFYYPDPEKVDGLPYIWGRNGTDVSQPNWEAEKVLDRQYWTKMTDEVHYLAMGFYFTGNMTFATTAAQKLREWFTDPATFMNPHGNYANWIRGQPPTFSDFPTLQSAGGLLELHRGIVKIIDAIGLLTEDESESVKWWSDEDMTAVRKWFAEYVKWMEESPRGVAEASSTNHL
ncbi:hypothetical protein HK102_012366, partial [Quaeritorhiza haematococci]